MGITISEWGPGAWNTLHVISHTYPERPSDCEKRDMKQFLHLFASYLPCPTCRKHFETMLHESIPSWNSSALASRTALISFMNDTHNEVNKRLGKRTFTIQEHYDVYRLPGASYPRDVLVVTLIALGAFGVVTCLLRSGALSRTTVLER